MKNISILFILVSLITFTSCHVKTVSQIGFDSDYTENSKGLTIKDVSSRENFLYLDGSVTVNKGELYIRLTNPEGEDVYEETIAAPANVEIIERYDAIPGFWKLRYESKDGRGHIKLHMK